MTSKMTSNYLQNDLKLPPKNLKWPLNSNYLKNDHKNDLKWPKMAISKLGLGHVRLFGALEYIQKREDRKIELRKQMKGETNGTWLPFV